MSTYNPDPTWTVPDQTQTIPGLPNPSIAFLNSSAAFPNPLLHWHLLSKHSRSGEHHSQTHLTIPNKPKTSWIPSTNLKLTCSPLNLKTQYMQLQSGEARTPSIISNWVSFLYMRFQLPYSLQLSIKPLLLLSALNWTPAWCLDQPKSLHQKPPYQWWIHSRCSTILCFEDIPSLSQIPAHRKVMFTQILAHILPKVGKLLNAFSKILVVVVIDIMEIRVYQAPTTSSVAWNTF